MACFQHLRNSAQFQAVMQGKVMGRTPHFVLHMLQWPPGAAPRNAKGVVPALFADGASYLGVMAPKRWARRAVTRSLVKRQMRAVADQHAHLIAPSCAVVLRLRAEFDRKVFVSAASGPLRQAIRTELLQLFGQLPLSAPMPAAAQATPPPVLPADAGGAGHARDTSGTMRGAS